jgi:hypothetical protein
MKHMNLMIHEAYIYVKLTSPTTSNKKAIISPYELHAALG